jgi:hypothetical protein
MENSDAILQALNRIEVWLTILAKAQLSPIANAEFAKPKMAELYNLTGTATQRQIKKALGISADTISDAWNRWERIGLVVRDGQQYRKVL